MTASQKTIEDYLLRLEIEDFLWAEADILDEFRYEEWLDLLTDDVSYWMPIRENVPSREMEEELTDEETEPSWFTDDKQTLTARVGQIRTHVHWADEPFSRISHVISNVRILGWTGRWDEVRVKCRFIFYRNRHSDEESTFIGKRIDTLRRVNGDWKIARREVYLDESVLLFKNLTNFF